MHFRGPDLPSPNLSSLASLWACGQRPIDNKISIPRVQTTRIGLDQAVCPSVCPKFKMNYTPRGENRHGPHSQPHSPVSSLLLEPAPSPTSPGGVPWEPGFKTQLVTSLRSPGRGHARDMAGPRDDCSCMGFWGARSRTGPRGPRRMCDDRWYGKRSLRRLRAGSTPVDDGNAAKSASESNGE